MFLIDFVVVFLGVHTSTFGYAAFCDAAWAILRVATPPAPLRPTVALHR